VDRLFDKLREVAPYPSGVCAVPDRIAGKAFFPGGDGLWKEDRQTERPAMPVGRVMVLAHNFDSVQGFQRSRKRGYEKNSTWTHLRALLEIAGIGLGECFFTNFYMGLKVGRSSRGKFPGAFDPEFVLRCRRFLLEQLSVQRPAVILALGTHVPRQLAEVAENLPEWRGVTTLKALDETGYPKKSRVRFRGVPSVQATVVALVHPSYRLRNVHRRHYAGKHGEAAELLMIREAVQEVRERT